MEFLSLREFTVFSSSSSSLEHRVQSHFVLNCFIQTLYRLRDLPRVIFLLLIISFSQSLQFVSFAHGVGRVR